MNLKVPSGMADKKLKWNYKRPLSEHELIELADAILCEDIPLDNEIFTDEELENEPDEYEHEEESVFPSTFFKITEKDTMNSAASAIEIYTEKEADVEIERALPVTLINNTENIFDLCHIDEIDLQNTVENNIDMNAISDNSSHLSNAVCTRSKQMTESKTDFETPNREASNEPKRMWKKKEKTTKIPEYNEHEGPVIGVFENCKNALDIYLQLLGKSVDDIVYQSNLYATQRNKALKLTKNELLSFIGINFMMAYHQLPSWKMYWNSSPDLGVPFDTNCMTRNRFEEILRYLHCNDNTSIPKNNKDKLYKVRPLATTLNENFKSMYKTTRCISIDESIDTLQRTQFFETI